MLFLLSWKCVIIGVMSVLYCFIEIKVNVNLDMIILMLVILCVVMNL